MSQALRMLGGGSSLNQVVSDMNTNILRLQPVVKGDFKKIVKSGITSGTAVAGSSVTVTIAHGQTYIPQVNVWAKSPLFGTYAPLPYLGGTIGVSLTIYEMVSVEVSSANIAITMRLGSSSGQAGVWTFKYEILDDTAN